MASIGEHVSALNTSLRGLNESFKQANTGYLASAVYIASSTQDSAVFALAHAGGSQEHYQRTDKHILRRLLTPQNSMAGEKFEEDTLSIAPSRMFPKQHKCLHIPLRTGTGRAQKSMLQLAFSAGQQIQSNDITTLLQHNQDFANIEGSLKTITTMTQDNRDDYFDARPAYTPRGIIILSDISKFTDYSQMLGHESMQRVAKKFCEDFMNPIANDFDAQLLRMEGDGVWLYLPFDDAASNRLQVSNRALEMSKTILEDFPKFTKKLDFSELHKAKIKVLAELSEITTMNWKNGRSTTFDRSSSTFTRMVSAAENIKNKKKNTALIGPELENILAGNNDAYHLISGSDFKPHLSI